MILEIKSEANRQIVAGILVDKYTVSTIKIKDEANRTMTVLEVIKTVKQEDKE